MKWAIDPMRTAIAFALLTSFFAGSLVGPSSVVADEGGQDEEPEVYIVTREFSVTHRGKGDRKERHGRTQRQGRRHVGSEVFQVKKNGTTVSLYPTLGVRDYGNDEELRGQVYSSTNAPASNVNRMRIGGALLQANSCSGIYDDPDPIPTEKTFTKVKSGTSPWTNWYTGTNDRWRQTGHNYFNIKLSNGNQWDSNVWGDVYVDL